MKAIPKTDNVILFDDGRKEYTINNDPSRVIRVNPGDFGLLDRISAGERKLNEIAQMHLNLSDDSTTEEITSATRELDVAVRELLDGMFDYPVSDVVFGHASSVALIGGKLFVQCFLDAFLPILTADIEKERKLAEKNISKYTDQMKGLSE